MPGFAFVCDSAATAGMTLFSTEATEQLAKLDTNTSIDMVQKNPSVQAMTLLGATDLLISWEDWADWWCDAFMSGNFSADKLLHFFSKRLNLPYQDIVNKCNNLGGNSADQADAAAESKGK